MSIPIENINICIVGCVSSGKSTLLNALFCHDYAQSKIKRTTMTPYIFIESHNKNIVHHEKFISDTIINNNNKIIKESEIDSAFNIEYYNDFIFYVEKMDIKICDNCLITIHDIPGLNDAKTKNIYYDYLKNNFHKYNIIFFVVDVQSGLNTSDEMDIINFIKQNIQTQKQINNKNIHLLIIANKADDMQLSENIDDKNQNVEIELNSELKEMYDQITNTITNMFKTDIIINSETNDKTDIIIDFVPLCAKDAHLYRMIKKYGSGYAQNLSDDIKLKIGINHYGKQFSKKTKKEKEELLNQIFDNEEFIDDMIKLSGFIQFENILRNFIKYNDVKFQIENINCEYQKISPINIKTIWTSLTEHLQILDKIKLISSTEYDIKVDILLQNMHNKIELSINKKSFGKIIDIKNFYDKINNLIKTDNYITATITYKHNFEIYPEYIFNKIFKIINNEYSEHKICIDNLNYINLLHQIGYCNKNNIEIILDNIIKNKHTFNTFVFKNNLDSYNDFLINLCDALKIADNFGQFLRFLLINIIHNKSTDENIIIKRMLYKKYDEIPINTYLDYCYRTNISWSKIFNACVNSITPECLQNPEYKLDIYYLEYQKSINI